MLGVKRARVAALHGDHALAAPVHEQRDAEPGPDAVRPALRRDVVVGAEVGDPARRAVAHHPAGGALALAHRPAQELVGLPVEAVDHQARMIASAPVHERDRLGLGDRATGLARDRLDQLLELQRRRHPPRARGQDLEIVNALLELLARPRQPREHQVDQEIGQRQQQEAQRLAGIVEQDEHDADRHQRDLGDHAGQRELVEKCPPAASEQAQPHALHRVVADQQQRVDRDDAQRDLDHLGVPPGDRIGAPHPAAQRDEPAAHPAEVQHVAELGEPARRIGAPVAARVVQANPGIDRQRDRDDATGADRAHAQRGRDVVGRIERQHAALDHAKCERPRRQDDDDEQRDPQHRRGCRFRQHAECRKSEHHGPARQSERDREQVTGRTRHSGVRILRGFALRRSRAL